MSIVLHQARAAAIAPELSAPAFTITNPAPCLALLAAIALAWCSSPAQAITATIDNIQYDITTFTGSYSSGPSKFATPQNGGQMPWFGDRALAKRFAFALNDDLGYPNAGIASPFFAHGTFLEQSVVDVVFGYPSGDNWLYQDFGYEFVSQPRTYAQASPLISSPTPVPGPLPFSLAGTAYVFCRKLRRRLRSRGEGIMGKRTAGNACINEKD